MVKNTSKHPYFQVGETVLIDITKEYATIKSSKKLPVGGWYHELQVISPGSSPYKYFYTYKEDYPARKLTITKNMSETGLSKVFDLGTMNFYRLIAYCNGGAYD